jgi:hypothetical protein
MHLPVAVSSFPNTRLCDWRRATPGN